MDWAGIAGGGFCELGVTPTSDIATQVAAALIFPNEATDGTLPHALAELPIHLIGHSRGASLFSEVARLSGVLGLWVDHFTTLDPHPCTADANVAFYDNVVFADNYYEEYWCTIPDGQPVNGAYNEYLASLRGGYGNCDGSPSNLSGEHSNVHLWYHGTIDLSTPTSDGQTNITSDMRTNWWTSSELQGVNTGFIFSRIAGGARTNAGLSALHGGLAIPGSNIVHGGGLQWPNIELRNPTSQWTAIEGDTIPIMFSYQDFGSSATITFATDGDQNPYNNSPINNIASVSEPSSASPSGEVPFFWTPTAADDGRYFFAQITDGVFTRYFYLPTPFQILPIADFRITAIGQEGNNIRVTWTGFGSKTNTLQAASTVGGSYSNISPDMVIAGGGESSTNFLDVGGATNSPSRFYRVRMAR